MTANTPAVVIVDEESREVSVLEMAGTFDPSLEEAFMTKVIKYQPLLHTISELGYRCRLFVFIFSSLRLAHRYRWLEGSNNLGCPKRSQKGWQSTVLSLLSLAAATYGDYYLYMAIYIIYTIRVLSDMPVVS